MDMYNLNRYQRITENISADGEFKPKVVTRHMQKHVVNKSYPICNHQKKKLEDMRWPPGTFFVPEKVGEPGLTGTNNI
jgi:hypothetical protein